MSEVEVSENNPSSVKVGALEFPVEWKDGLCDDQGVTLRGQYNGTDDKIYIVKGLAPHMAQAVLWHEVLHVVSSMYSIGLKEVQIRPLANCIVQLLADNLELR